MRVLFYTLARAIAMKTLSTEHFKTGIDLFCGLTFIGIVLLQAWPNEGTSQSSGYNHKIHFANDRCSSFCHLKFLSNPFYISSVSLSHLIVHENIFTKRLTLHKSSLLQIKAKKNISEEDLHISHNRNSPFKDGAVLTPKGNSHIKRRTQMLVGSFEKKSPKGTKIIFFSFLRGTNSYITHYHLS